MIIIDMNQISIAAIMMHLHMQKSKEPAGKMVRHMILNSVRMYRSMFNQRYGEVVLAYDSRNYWRRDFFFFYKMNRKKSRDGDNKDWDAIFTVLNEMKEEYKQNLPYKFLEIDGAEADDIIGVLCSTLEEPIMIVSGDKDFIQLQKYSNVHQYSPIQKKHITHENPTTYIKEHILKGDTSDGIPNVLSPDHTFTEGLRQKPLGKKRIESWLDRDDFDEEVKRNYQRNKMLIDLDQIPSWLVKQILDAYETAACGDRSNLLNYFIAKRLKNLTETIGEF